MFHGLLKDISCIESLDVGDFEALFKRCKCSGNSGSLWIALKMALNLVCFTLRHITGTHLLTAIIDASWKVYAYYNGVCMRQGVC